MDSIERRKARIGAIRAAEVNSSNVGSVLSWEWEGLPTIAVKLRQLRVQPVSPANWSWTWTILYSYQMLLAWLRTYTVFTASLCWAHLFKHFGTRTPCIGHARHPMQTDPLEGRVIPLYPWLWSYLASWEEADVTVFFSSLCWFQASLSTSVLSDLLAGSFLGPLKRQRMHQRM